MSAPELAPPFPDVAATAAGLAAADYLDLLDARTEMTSIANRTSAPFDA